MEEELTCDGSDVCWTGFSFLWNQGSGGLFLVKEGVVHLQWLRWKHL